MEWRRFHVVCLMARQLPRASAGRPFLEMLADDPDPEVRKNVRWAMQRLAPGSLAAH